MSNPTWTREKPTVAGWYWWKRPGYEPTIAEVYGPPGGLLLWLPGEDTTREESISVSGAYDDTEFLGPITPDSFQQGRVEGLREAGEYAHQCKLERNQQIVNLGGTLHGDHWKDWLECKASEARRIADKCEQLAQQAQEEKGVGDGN